MTPGHAPGERPSNFTHLQALLTELGDGAATLSDAVALRYFSHTDDARRSLGA